MVQPVMKVPLGGGAITTLVSTGGYSLSIAVDATSVYWTGNRTVMSVPKGGGSPTTLASKLCFPLGLVVDTTTVYLESGGCADAGRPDLTVEDVMSIPKGGGTLPTLLSLTAPNAGPLAVDSTSLYWPDFHCPSHRGLCSGAVMRLTPK
jgi:hypothetical protein